MNRGSLLHCGLCVRGCSLALAWAHMGPGLAKPLTYRALKRPPSMRLQGFAIGESIAQTTAVTVSGSFGLLFQKPSRYASLQSQPLDVTPRFRQQLWAYCRVTTPLILAKHAKRPLHVTGGSASVNTTGWTRSCPCGRCMVVHTLASLSEPAAHGAFIGR